MSDADLLGSPAGTDGAPDVVYRIIDSPVGPLLLAATDSGLVRVVFEREGFQTKLDRLAAPRARRRLDRNAPGKIHCHGQSDHDGNGRDRPHQGKRQGRRLSVGPLTPIS